MLKAVFNVIHSISQSYQYNPFLHISAFKHTEEKKLQEHIMEKGEIVQNEQFHLFPKHFPCNLYLLILNPLPGMPILGSSNSATNKDRMS